MTERIIHKNDYNAVIDVPLSGIKDASISSRESKIAARITDYDKRILNILIPQSCIKKRINALAREIMNDHKKNERIDILVVMTGAMVFASDLIRELYAAGAEHLFVHFIKTRTYASDVKKSGETKRDVAFTLAPDGLKEKNVIIVDDIVDQGFTLSWLCEYMKNEIQSASIKICALLNKKLENPSKQVAKLREKLHIDYSGFFIQDRWISGYGIDTDGEFRHLPFIVTIDEDYYK